MKKSVLLVLALWLCHLTLMATTVSQQRRHGAVPGHLCTRDEPLQKIVMNIAGGDNVLRVITITVPQNLKDGVWYDLQGRKYVNQPTQRGIYILNGKKILIK